MLFTDITELKTALEIDLADTSEDVKLVTFLEQASSWIGEIINRPGFDYQSRTEYYDGTGTQQLCLRSRPVYTSPTPQVFIDEAGYYGSASGSFPSTSALVYGTDFALKLDQADGTSRSGILIRLKDAWPRPSVRKRGLLSPYAGEGFGCVKVVYTAGYTTDNLPAVFRLACVTLVARMRHFFPLALELNSENYEDRSISWSAERKNYLMALVKPMLNSFRNWKW